MRRIRQRRHVVAYVLDLDNFKAVNNGRGLPWADGVLTSVAGRFRHVMGDG
ncbi:diguanylate cyclase domain-containing protein [Paenibacillus macerans]|uniref:diguanylate cyclase domain-containing protein n=1 Tax=Paenibacillus macerans TaxID=44252 RepID=UPI0035A23B06